MAYVALSKRGQRLKARSIPKSQIPRTHKPVSSKQGVSLLENEISKARKQLSMAPPAPKKPSLSDFFTRKKNGNQIKGEKARLLKRFRQFIQIPPLVCDSMNKRLIVRQVLCHNAVILFMYT